MFYLSSLKQTKVNINATDPHLGRTPLHFAAEYNRPTLAKLLVSKGAMVDAVDNMGETATEIATKLKWKKVAAILTDPSVLFWNFANRANKLYKAMEYDLAVQVVEVKFDVQFEFEFEFEVEYRFQDDVEGEVEVEVEFFCFFFLFCETAD